MRVMTMSASLAQAQTDSSTSEIEQPSPRVRISWLELTCLPCGEVAGYIEDQRIVRPVYPGDTLVAESDVIGLREVSSGEAGVVHVRTRGTNQRGQEVLSFVRWVMVPKRDPAQAKGINTVPQIPAVVSASMSCRV